MGSYTHVVSSYVLPCVKKRYMRCCLRHGYHMEVGRVFNIMDLILDI